MTNNLNFPNIILSFLSLKQLCVVSAVIASGSSCTAKAAPSAEAAAVRVRVSPGQKVAQTLEEGLLEGMEDLETDFLVLLLQSVDFGLETKSMLFCLYIL